MDALRVLYVEDDPALRGILSAVLSARPTIEIVAAVGTSREALDVAAETPIDVALLDLALGADSMTGMELGVAIREIHPNLGIVILSQHRIPGYLQRMSPAQRRGWSFILKRADLQPQYLSDVLHSTHRGLIIVDPAMVDGTDSEGDGMLDRLSARQREILALAAQGLDAPSIADRKDMTAVAVRQDLSRAYQVLVPDPPAGADLRTMAILQYLKLTRSFESH